MRAGPSPQSLYRIKLCSYTWTRTLRLRRILAWLTHWAPCHPYVTHTPVHSLKLLLDAGQAVLKMPYHDQECLPLLGFGPCVHAAK